MNKAYKFRIYPNSEQRILFAKTFGCVCFVYNRMLADKFAKKKSLTPAKYKDEFGWLREVDSLALCNAQMNLSKSFENHRKNAKHFGKPRFKSKINGQKTTVVKIYAESPLMEIAEIKNQILRINTELLNIPFNRSPRAIKIEGYIVSWVETIVRHKNMNSNIKPDNIYEYAEVNEADRSAKRNVRNAVEATLNYLKEKGRISNWTYTMVDSHGRVVPYKSGNPLYGIQILR